VATVHGDEGDMIRFNDTVCAAARKERVMRTLFVIVLVSMVCAACCHCVVPKQCCAGSRTPSEFVSLFNGKSFDGWVIMGDPEGWKIQDGIIHSDGGKGGNWLRSVKEYSDFILTLEWKVSPRGNSGVFVRCTEQGNPWETGHEIQISNEQPPRDDMHCTGALYGTVAVNPRPDESPNRWRTYEIACIGKRITVKIDGVQCVDADMDKVPAIKNKPMRGYIGIQDSHTGPGCTIEYRNIRIKEL